MKIKLQEALDLVASADAIKLNHCIRPMVYVEEITGELNNEVIYIHWEEDDQEFNLKVTEGNNFEVERDGHKLTFIDMEGDAFALELFKEVPMKV